MPADNDAPPLIRALHQAGAYRHSIAGVSLVETHISWVLLTGQYAYKIKKPVKLGFLNFSTLERRLEACREELRLNRRFAPDLYLDIVPITGTEREPNMDGSGQAIEYAVRMREFPQSAQLDRLLEAGELPGEDLEAFGRRLATLHSNARRAGEDDEFGTPHHVQTPMRETLDELLADPLDDAVRRTLTQLSAWIKIQNTALAPVFADRKQSGRIREGHGDLHLANLVRLGGVVTPFDCIEFSAALRWNDTISDMAFLVMDLIYRRRTDLAYRFLNAYLEASGDYQGVRVLRYYLIYRALVRAKVEMIRAGEISPAERPRHHSIAAAYIELAQSWAQSSRPLLILMHGLSGSGKTWISDRLAFLLPAIRIRSDVERKRLHGLTARTRSGSGLAAGIYAAETTKRTYDHLATVAESILSGGESAIIDATFLDRTQRERFRTLARQLKVPCLIVDCQAPQTELERRLAIRAKSALDASEANQQVLEHQRVHTDSLDASERAATLAIDTTAHPDLEAIAKMVRGFSANDPAGGSAR